MMKNNINFLKIIFTIGIMYGHLLQFYLIGQFYNNAFYQKLYNYTSYSFGYMCEFFFIISGYFLLKDFNAYDINKFITKKILRLWPAFLFSIIILYILSRFSIGPWYDINVIPELFFLNFTVVYGLPTINGVSWYITSLFWVSIFYFFVFKLFNEKSIYIVFFITFFSYLILFNKVHLYNEPKVFNSFISFYLIRGFAGIGLGILFRYFIIVEESCNVNIKTLFLGLLEVILLYLIILFLSIKKIDYSFPISIVLFSILFYLFIKSMGIFSVILNKDKIIIPFLSKYIYTTYIMQWVSFQILNKFLYHNQDYGATKYSIFNIIISLVLCFFIGILTYHSLYIIELIIRKIIFNNRSKIKNILEQERIMNM
ncbi:acyltransferase, partial [Brachyspira pulli]|uniref:acyltransferase family protein n=1 Tax=Brachyspira pulli TaxID=310721 RepID=UPI0030043CEF